MSRAKVNDPTKPRPKDKAGRDLDEHGLPLSGPARRRALAGKPDPNDAQEATGSVNTVPVAPEKTETKNG